MLKRGEIEGVFVFSAFMFCLRLYVDFNRFGERTRSPIPCSAVSAIHVHSTVAVQRLVVRIRILD